MRTRSLPLLLLVVALFASACGSVEEASDANVSDSASEPASESASGSASESSSAPASDEPFSVADARGITVELDAAATAVVGLEWGVVENLVSLDVMPVGVADPDGYSAWVSAAPLGDDVVDVGMRGEPSVDAIVGLDPELVVTTTDLSADIIEQLEEFVPVLVVRAAAAEQPIQQMRDNLQLVAEAVGRTDEAEALLSELDAALAEGAAAVGDAGMTGQSFTLADGWVEGSNVSIRAFTAGSLAGAVGEELGLENAWDLEGDPNYGLAVTDVEGLTALGETEFLYYSNEAEEDDPFELLAGNAIWDSLPFVEAGSVTRLPDGIWMFGGPRSTIQLIDAVVEAVSS